MTETEVKKKRRRRRKQKKVEDYSNDPLFVLSLSPGDCPPSLVWPLLINEAFLRIELLTLVSRFRATLI